MYCQRITAKWCGVHRYFQVGRIPRTGETAPVLDTVLKKLAAQTRTKNGREPVTSFGIIDAQSVKHTETAHASGRIANDPLPRV